MKILDIIKARTPVFSFEFFPPKTEQDANNLYATLKELGPLKPDFVSVTNSSDRAYAFKTGELSKLIKDKFSFEPAAHLTCISHSKSEIEVLAGELKSAGISNILALRGDIPKTGGAFKEYKYASELVPHLKKLGDFCIGVAGYPEKHPEAKSLESDIEHLKIKTSAGADYIVTQLFFNNASYFNFVEKCRKAGINQPVIPGIMPVTNVKQIKKFAEMCGAVIPEKLASQLALVQDDPIKILETGIRYTLNQCRELLQSGVPGLHFYTLNKSKATIQILETLKQEFKVLVTP